MRPWRASLTEADGIRRRGVVLTTLSKLKQVCNHPAQFLGDNSTLPGRSGKLASARGDARGSPGGGRAGPGVHPVARRWALDHQNPPARRRHDGEEVLFLHGGVPRSKRDRMVKRFQEAGASIFLLSAQGRRHRSQSDRRQSCVPLRPLVEPGGGGSGHGPGLPHRADSRGANVHKFLAPRKHAPTFGKDRRDDRAQEGGGLGHRGGAGEAWLTELTTEQLTDILSLREDAVGQ